MASAALVWTSACGGGGGGGGSTSPPVQPSPITVSISPTSAQLFLGTTQQFSATVVNASNPGVTWVVNGNPGGNTSIGTITTSGLYTAPQVLPNPPSVTVTAISVQDPLRSASASVTINSDVNISVAPTSANVELGAMQQFTATVTGTGSPSTSVSWSVDNISGGNASVGTISPTGLYTAPGILPAPPQVTVRATSLADPSRVASAVVTVTSTFAFAVSGPDVVINGAQAQYTAVLTPAPGSNPNPGATWTVSGMDCTGAACGTIDANTGLYRAPTQPPAPSPVVRITGTSVADPSKSAFLDVQIATGIAVFVSPQQVTLSLNGTQQFTATVGGTTDTSVTWSVSGASCAGANCGIISADGLYTAPGVAPSPNNEVTITATSVADPLASDTATVLVDDTGMSVHTLAPASLTAGAAGSFTLRVTGINFVASVSEIVFNGSPRTSNCTTVQCTMTLNAADVATPGPKSVQVRTSDGGGTVFSNQVELVVTPQPGPPAVIALTTGNPTASGMDIVVVDPTTAGGGTPQISFDAVGLFVAGVGCSLRGTSVYVTRPAAGNAQVDICVRGNGISPVLQFWFSGPNDLMISSIQDQSFDTVRLTLTLTETTQLGPRTLFVENSNKERAALSGGIVVRAP